jgi:hypothetical protein
MCIYQTSLFTKQSWMRKMKFDMSVLERYVEAGHITKRPHPVLPLFIFNYTPSCVYEKVWDEFTLSCRGLILDHEGQVIGRPFKKFFNYGEVNTVPSASFTAYEKMDGSLGILCFYGDTPVFATRGSFESTQAAEFAKIIRQGYPNVTIPTENTYLFEIIYPENRIVVDYGTTRDVCLLAVVRNDTGQELDISDFGVFPQVKRYTNLKTLTDIISCEQESNREGFVLKFEDAENTRIKFKFEEYVRLHSILTNFSTIDLWEILKSGDKLEKYLDKVPDEFNNWVKITRDELERNFREIELESKATFDAIPKGSSRKEFAKKAIANKRLSGILFCMLDGRDYSEAIWKMVRPQYSKPFAASEATGNTL